VVVIAILTLLVDSVLLQKKTTDKFIHRTEGTIMEINKQKCTMELQTCSQRASRQLADGAVYAAGGYNGHHLESRTSCQKLTAPIDACLLEEQSGQVLV